MIGRVAMTKADTAQAQSVGFGVNDALTHRPTAAADNNLDAHVSTTGWEAQRRRGNARRVQVALRCAPAQAFGTLRAGTLLETLCWAAVRPLHRPLIEGDQPDDHDGGDHDADDEEQFGF